MRFLWKNNRKAAFIILISISVCGAILLTCNKSKEFKVPFNCFSEIEKVIVKYPYLKKQVLISNEMTKEIVENLCNNGRHAVSSQLSIHIYIYVKGRVEPYFFLITSTGWSNNMRRADDLSYKNNNLGEKLYDELYGQLMTNGVAEEHL